MFDAFPVFLSSATKEQPSYSTLRLTNSLDGAVKLTWFSRQLPLSLQNRRDFLRISGEQRRKRGERVASAWRARGERELRARGGSLKNPACPHTIVQAVPAFKYERGYLIGYFETRDPRMFFQDVTQSRTAQAFRESEELLPIYSCLSVTAVRDGT